MVLSAVLWNPDDLHPLARGISRIRWAFPIDHTMKTVVGSSSSAANTSEASEYENFFLSFAACFSSAEIINVQGIAEVWQKASSASCCLVFRFARAFPRMPVR
jgi:hypothetical protein